jgi:hypothetical protein
MAAGDNRAPLSDKGSEEEVWENWGGRMTYHTEIHHYHAAQYHEARRWNTIMQKVLTARFINMLRY